RRALEARSWACGRCLFCVFLTALYIAGHGRWRQPGNTKKDNAKKKRAASAAQFAHISGRLAPELSGGDPATRRHAIHPEHKDRAESRADESRRLARAIQMKCLPDESAEERADDSENDGQQDSTRIATGHDELRDDPDDQTEKDTSENTHESPFPSGNKSK